MSASRLAFEDWKVRLHSDCQLMDKVLGYNNLGEECLKLLWEAGTEPSVEGIISGGEKPA
jgi:hypothetical protein